MVCLVFDHDPNSRCIVHRQPFRACQVKTTSGARANSWLSQKKLKALTDAELERIATGGPLQDASWGVNAQRAARELRRRRASRRAQGELPEAWPMGAGEV